MKSVLKLIMVTLALAGSNSQACVEHASHEPSLQHGFVLSNEDRFASHLVASGHHSRQTEVIGSLVIESQDEREFYEGRKQLNSDGRVFFLFQAQNLVLSEVSEGDVLQGHIIESAVGKYEPKNTIVKSAKYKVEKVLLNLENPFFGAE